MGRKIRRSTVVGTCLAILCIQTLNVEGSMRTFSDGNEPVKIEESVEAEESGAEKESEDTEEGKEGETEKEPGTEGESEDIKEYKLEYDPPDGKNGFYITKPDIRILHQDEKRKTKYQFVRPDGSELTGELSTEEPKVEITEKEFQEGVHFLKIWMEDEKEEICAERTIEFKIDTKAPLIRLTAPEGFDTWYKEEAVLQASAEDGGSQMEYLNVYEGKKLIATGAERELTFTVSSFSERGEGISVYAEAYDYAGNKGSVSQIVLIDNKAPEVKIDGIENYMITSQPMEVVYRVGEENVLAFYSAQTIRQKEDKSQETIQTGEWKYDGKNQVLSQVLDENGIYKLAVKAVDEAGHESGNSAQVIIDKGNPVISHVDELDGKYMKEFSWNYEISETIKDFTSYSYAMQLDGKPYMSNERVVKEGQHEFAIKAADAAGNTAEARAAFIVDHTKPKVILSGIEQGKTYEEVTAGIRLENPEDWIEQILINGEIQKTEGKEDMFQYQFQEPGIYEVAVTARDNAGNQEERVIDFEVKEEKKLMEKVVEKVVEKVAGEAPGKKENPEDKNESNVKEKKNIFEIIAVLGFFGGVTAGAVYLKKRNAFEV